MLKPILQAGLSTLAGYAVKKMLNGNSIENRIKEAIDLFSNIEPIDIDDEEEVYDDAVEIYHEEFEDDTHREIFGDHYIGSFLDVDDIGKYLLAQDKNYNFLNEYGSVANEIVKSNDLIADHYMDYLIANNKITVVDCSRSLHSILGTTVYHVFKD